MLMFDCYINEEELPLIMTFAEVQELLLISRHTLMKLLSQNKLRGFKVGRQWRVKKEELLRYISGADEDLTGV